MHPGIKPDCLVNSFFVVVYENIFLVVLWIKNSD